MPGKPAEASHIVGPFVDFLRGTWSDPTVEISPDATPSHRPSIFAWDLNGGLTFPSDPMGAS